MANNISFASKYSGDIDKIIAQGAKTGFLADNTFKAKFSGASTVYLPEVSMDGLGDYSRTVGYSKGDTSLTYTPYTLNMERSKQLFLDAQDADESGVADLAGKLVGEYTRTKVIPETDAYNISALAKIAAQESNSAALTMGKEIAGLLELINNAEEACAYESSNLIALVDRVIYGALQTSTELSRYITVNNFSQGGIDLKVKNLNGVNIIPVDKSRMFDEFNFGDKGFAPTETAKAVHALVLPKDSASFVKKVDKCDVYDPSQVQDYDAYKINFRLYYDLIVKTSRKGTIFALTA